MKTYGGSALIRRNSIPPRVAATFSLDGSIRLLFAASASGSAPSPTGAGAVSPDRGSVRCRDPTSRPGRPSAIRRRLPRTPRRSPATRSGPPTITWSPAPSARPWPWPPSSSSASTTSPPHDTVNGERRRRRRQVRRLLPEALHATAPPVPAVGVRGRHLAHRGIGAADPHRVAAVARGVDRVAQRGDAFGDGPEVEPEALVLLAALLVARADARPAVARVRGSAPACRSRSRAPRAAATSRARRATRPRSASSPPPPRPSARTSRARDGGSPAASRRKRWSYANTPSSPARLGRVRDRERRGDVVAERRQREPELHAGRPASHELPGQHRRAHHAGLLAELGGRRSARRAGARAPSMRPSNAARSGASSTSPSSTSPPDTTMSSGSKMFTSPTSPTATLTRVLLHDRERVGRARLSDVADHARR